MSDNAVELEVVDQDAGSQDIGAQDVVESAPTVESAPVTAEDAAVAPLDWAGLRESYAKGDEKTLKRLSRYSSTEAALDALIAAQNKISSGGLKQPLSEKPSAEELATWRADNGVPAVANDYDITLPSDLELSPDQEAIVDGFVQSSHAANMTSKQVEASIGYLMQSWQDRQEASYVKDENDRLSAKDALRQEWGAGEYTSNINIINSVLDNAPEGTKDLFFSARLQDGTALGNHTGILRWLANVARELNPVMTVIPGSTTNSPDALDGRLSAIKAMMGDESSKYWKGPESTALQAEFLKLATVQEKLKR